MIGGTRTVSRECEEGRGDRAEDRGGEVAGGGEFCGGGGTWSTAMKTWVLTLEPGWTPKNWDALNSKTRSELVLQKILEMHIH